MTNISHLSKDQQAVINADKGFAEYHRRMRLRDIAMADAGLHPFEPLFYDAERCHDCDQPRQNHPEAK